MTEDDIELYMRVKALEEGMRIETEAVITEEDMKILDGTMMGEDGMKVVDLVLPTKTDDSHRIIVSALVF
jgi:hypothetical protein